MKRILDYDPFSRITTIFDYIPSTDTTVIYREQDVEPFLKLTHAMRNDPETTKQGMKMGWWHYAVIPNIVIEKWMSELGVNVYNKDHEKKVFQLLNKPEYRYLKTTTKMHRG